MPTWKELKRFLDHETGWELCKEGSDHWWYRRQTSDGGYQFVRISRGTGEIGKALFQRILKHQLGVSKEYFNSKK